MNKRRQASRAKAAPGKNSFYPLFAILVLCVICFSPVLKNELLNWDDHAYIRDNPVIRELSFSHLSYLFRPDTYIIGNYHPLTILTYCIEYKIAGINPDLFHFTNLVLHLLNICLLFYFLFLLTGNPVITTVTSFLFALHPMRVESVAWAAERKDVLYAFFFLLSLIVYFFYIRQNGSRKWYFLSLLFFLLSCFSKGQAVVLPLTLFLVDFFLKKPISIKSFIPKIPFFILSLVFGIIAIRAQHTSLTDIRLESFSFGERMLFACYNLLAYVYKLLLPYNLACFYGYPHKTNGMLPAVFYASPLILLVTGFLIYKYSRRNAYIMFGLLFFLFTLFIVIQLLPVGDAIIADRYTYIPYIGLFFIIGYAADRVLSGNTFIKNKTLFRGVLVLQAGIFCYATFAQVKTWKNSETLWTQTLKVNPEEAVAYYDRGMHYLDQNLLDKALPDFQNAIRYKPEYYEAYNSIGTVYERKNENSKAIEYYSASISKQPLYAVAWFNRAITWRKIENYKNAIEDLSRVIQLEPGNANAYYERGLSHKSLKEYDKAIEDYKKAIELNPSFSDAYVNYGNVYYNQDLYDKAIELYGQAIQVDPKNAKAYMNRSFNYYMKKDFRKAHDDAMRARQYGETVDEQYLQILKAGMR